MFNYEDNLFELATVCLDCNAELVVKLFCI